MSSYNFTEVTNITGISEILDNTTYYNFQVDISYTNLILTIITICQLASLALFYLSWHRKGLM